MEEVLAPAGWVMPECLASARSMAKQQALMLGRTVMTATQMEPESLPLTVTAQAHLMWKPELVHHPWAT